MENQILGQEAEEIKEVEEQEQLVANNLDLGQNKLVLIRKLLSNVEENVRQLSVLLGANLDLGQISHISIGQAIDESSKQISGEHSDKIIEGVFDGESMIGPDGKRYNISSNYASKSKLVEGDILKLSITNSGTFVYKQIGPIERSRVIGALKRVGDNEFIVIKDDRSWKILTASVTYFKGDDGDEAVILVPKVGESRWAAVENIIRQA